MKNDKRTVDRSTIPKAAKVLTPIEALEQKFDELLKDLNQVKYWFDQASELYARVHAEIVIVRQRMVQHERTGSEPPIYKAS